MFGPLLASAGRYADLLAGPGVERGLIGPREVPRLWDRHLLNSAVLAELVPDRVGVLDAGSGAGLPGIPLALARPDLTVVLVEPLLRRVEFLRMVVELLDLGQRVEVVRSRAEDLPAAVRADVVTARAVAPLDRLVGWCLPLVRPHGVLLAIKGSRAQAEVTAAAVALRRHGSPAIQVVEVGRGVVTPPAVVVRIGPVGRDEPGRARRRAR